MHIPLHGSSRTTTRLESIYSGLWVNVVGLVVSFTLSSQSERRERLINGEVGQLGEPVVLFMWGEKIIEVFIVFQRQGYIIDS